MVIDWQDATFLTYNNVPYIEEGENYKNSFERFIVNQGDSVKALGLDAGYAGDTIDVFTADVPYHSNQHPGYWATPNENAYPILEYTEEFRVFMAENMTEICGDDFCLENPRYAAFVYDKGVEMEYEEIAPEKRAFFFFHRMTAEVVTDAVWDIFDAMVYWCVGCLDRADPGPLPNETFKNTMVSEPAIKVFPNPTSNFLNIKLNGLSGDKYQLDIYNLLGKKVYSQQVKANSAGTYRASLPEAGFYMLKLSEGDKPVKVMKIIKK
jgi:hypothetical protein